MTWYKSKTGNHQGLVIDEQTGENIAVTYKKENARLVAAAPDLLKACYLIDDAYSGNGTMITAVEACLRAIAKAEGRP